MSYGEERENFFFLWYEEQVVPSLFFSLPFFLNSKLCEKHPMMISCSWGVQSHILIYSCFCLIHLTIICSFIHTLLPPSVILLLSKTHQSLVPFFFQLSFQMKTRLTLVWQWHIAAVCHHIPSPQHVLAKSPRVDFPLHLFFPYIHPSSKHFLLMTTASSSLSSPYYCWFASFHLSVSVWAASEL